MRIDKAIMLEGPVAPDRAWQSHSPLSLLPVANKPVLFHGLDALERAGLRSATVIAGPAAAGALRTALSGADGWDLDVTVQESSGAAMIDALRAAGAEFPLLVQPAGTLLHEALAPHIQTFVRERPAALSLRVPGSPAGARSLDGGWLLSTDAIEALLGAPDETDPVRTLRERLGAVCLQDVDGCMAGGEDVGALLEGNHRVLQRLVPSAGGAAVTRTKVRGAVLVHPTARVEDSFIRGPAIIGPHAQILHAYIGPSTSIGAHATVEGAEIEHSIVMEGAEIRFVGTRIEESVIGRSAYIGRTFDLPSALRLTVGDGARIGLT
jgi:glucose-1-phosphate thymidylyltransferase